MGWLPWDKLPQSMKNNSVKPYYDLLAAKRASMVAKRVFDFICSIILLIILAIPMLIIAAMIKADSNGPVMFRQERVTRYGKSFRIFKFRTMVVNAESLGAQVTSGNDSRITKMGHRLRKTRLDEIPQILNIITGDMSLVGTRPEVPKYVDKYTEEMMATLLMPAGVTSLASVTFKDEDKMMEGASNPEEVYIEQVLPVKMEYNLESLRTFGFFKDFAMLFKTVGAVLK